MSETLLLPLSILAGLALGTAHFGSLAWNARLFAEGKPGKALALQAGRFFVLISVLAELAKLGTRELIAAALGLTVVRLLAGGMRRRPM